MLYMYILGWEVDFGHVEAVNLIAGNKYTEKQIVRLVATHVWARPCLSSVCGG
jgi:AP-2 complex subunit alpha